MSDPVDRLGKGPDPLGVSRGHGGPSTPSPSKPDGDLGLEWEYQLDPLG